MRGAAHAAAFAVFLGLGACARPAFDLASPPLPAERDAEGFFRVTEPVASVRAAGGVRFAAGRYGRALDGAERCDVFVRGADGAFVVRRLAFTPSPVPLRPAAIRAVTESDEIPPAARSLARGDSVALPPPSGPAAGAPLDFEPRGRGADLAAYPAKGAAFARFRDVEAMFRVCGEADRLAARILAARGDGRDYRTFRELLRRLRVPEIWKANPGGEKGSGECAIVVHRDPERPARGEPDAALLLRIRDPALHHMETLAGITLAGAHEAMTARAEDPFPERRRTAPTRRVSDDVEIAEPEFSSRMFRPATDPSRSLAAQPDWKARRGEVPAPEEAAFARIPRLVRGEEPGADEVAVRRREAAGWLRLAADWLGAPAGPDDGSRAPLLSHRATLGAETAGTIWIRVVTDERGLRVSVECEAASDAERIESLLALAARPLPNHADVCRSNRDDLSVVALSIAAGSGVARRGPPLGLAERAFLHLGFEPVCPCGGRYDAHPATREVSCTAHGADGSPREGVAPPRALVRALAREGRTVSFTMPVDWERRD